MAATSTFCDPLRYECKGFTFDCIRTVLQVVACFKGRGWVTEPGYTLPEQVEGRLWLYSDGGIGFIFLDGFDFLVDLTRMDKDLL